MNELDGPTEKLESAKADLDAATAKRRASKAAVVRAEAEVTLAKASYQAAGQRIDTVQTQLRRIGEMKDAPSLTIRSPIDGVVVQKNIEPGVLVGPSDQKPLFRLQASTRLRGPWGVPQEAAVAVKPGAPATVKLDALPGESIAGKINRIGYQIDRGTGELKAEIALPNAEGLLKPGMRGQARVVTAVIADGLSVPHAALFDYTALTSATCIRLVNGANAATQVTLGMNLGDSFQIVQGLAANDMVLTGFFVPPPDGKTLEELQAHE